MVELLKQGQYTPYDVTDQIIAIYAGTQGFLDDIPRDRIAEFEQKLLGHIRDEYPEYRDELREKGELSAELGGKLAKTFETFKARFTAG